MPSLPRRAAVRGMLVASATAATFAAAVPAASAFTSVSIYDGVVDDGWGADSVSAWNTSGPTTLEIVRAGATIAGGPSGDMLGYSNVDLAAGDVIRVYHWQTKALLAETTYAGKPAVVACPGGTTFTGTGEGGEVHVSAYPDETVVRYSDADFGYVDSEVVVDGGRFSGTWSRALPAQAMVQAYETRGSYDDTDPNAVVVSTVVSRRVADLCPAPAATPTPAPVAVPKPAVPGKPVVVAPKELAKQLLQTTLQTLTKGGVASIAKPQTVPVTVTSPGTLQIQQFSGSAPKKVTAYAAAAKKKAKAKKVALPKNLIASGSKTFAKAGKGAVKVTPTKRAKALTKGKKRLTVTVRVVFTPKGGKPVATDQKVTLTRKK